MRVLSKLMGRQTTALATVQVPSTDLIRGDDELIMPVPEEIQCKMTQCEFEKYKTIFDQKELRINNLAFIVESFRQYCQNQGILEYDLKEVEKLLDRQLEIKRMANGNTGRIERIWRSIYRAKSNDGHALYQQEIPHRIINRIKSVISWSEELGFNVKISVSDITSAHTYLYHPPKSMVYFLQIRLSTEENPGNNNFSDMTIIDAWRGPTFSDEEAKI